MVVGENNDLALGYENDEGGDGGASSGLADSGNTIFPNTISTSNPNVVTLRKNQWTPMQYWENESYPNRGLHNGRSL